MTDSTRTCPNCLTPVSTRDRVCFVCHRPLVSSTPAAVAAERVSSPKTTTASESVTQPVPQSTTNVPELIETASVADSTTSTSLSIGIQWGRTRSDSEIPSTGSTIGSTSRADITIPATFLDPVHARIYHANGKWMLESMTSVGLVLRQGSLVTRTEVESGDVIRLADRVGNFASLRIRGERSEGARSGGLRGALPGVNQTLVVGSGVGCAIRLEHPLVRPRHALLRRDPAGNLILDDRTSVAGTYVNGQRLRGHCRLGIGDTVQIGPFSARVGTDALEGLDQVPGIDVVVNHGSVTTSGARGGRRQLLTDVSLHLPPASLTAVAGPSGAGKTTLMRLLSGQTPASGGSVAYNGVDLSQCRHAYAGLMGFVPQDDVVHVDLTVAEALGYQARLRLGPECTVDERRARIGRALEFVGLVEQQTQLVKTLSGGQRKRVSIACELLNEPEILFLDEPTSGLDPGLDKRMMLLLRLLADQGRTVILTTHAIAHVDVCETLVLVGPGGRVIYAGDPDEATTWFGVPELGDAFSLVETPEASADAAARLIAEQQVTHPLPEPQAISAGAVRADLGDADVPIQSKPRFMSPPWREIVSYFGRVFVGRYLRLLGRDRVALAFSLLQGLAVTLLTYLVRPAHFTWASGGSSTMFVFGCASVWFGMINSVRELVKERTIWRREALAGANVAAYLSSKLIVLGALSAVQSLSMVAIIDVTFKLPTHGPLPGPFLTVGLTLWLANLCGMAMGLLCSAFAPSSDRAMSIVPYLLITQFVLCGVLFPLGDLGFVSWFIPAHWAVAALGGIARVTSLPTSPTSGLYPHSALGLVGMWMVLIGLLALGIAVTARVLQRQADRWSVG